MHYFPPPELAPDCSNLTPMSKLGLISACRRATIGRIWPSLATHFADADQLWLTWGILAGRRMALVWKSLWEVMLDLLEGLFCMHCTTECRPTAALPRTLKTGFGRMGLKSEGELAEEVARRAWQSSHVSGIRNRLGRIGSIFGRPPFGIWDVFPTLLVDPTSSSTSHRAGPPIATNPCIVHPRGRTRRAAWPSAFRPTAPSPGPRWTAASGGLPLAPKMAAEVGVALTRWGPELQRSPQCEHTLRRQRPPPLCFRKAAEAHLQVCTTGMHGLPRPPSRFRNVEAVVEDPCGLVHVACQSIFGGRLNGHRLTGGGSWGRVRC